MSWNVSPFFLCEMSSKRLEFWKSHVQIHLGFSVSRARATVPAPLNNERNSTQWRPNTYMYKGEKGWPGAEFKSKKKKKHEIISSLWTSSEQKMCWACGWKIHRQLEADRPPIRKCFSVWLLTPYVGQERRRRRTGLRMMDKTQLENKEPDCTCFARNTTGNNPTRCGRHIQPEDPPL